MFMLSFYLIFIEYGYNLMIAFEVRKNIIFKFIIVYSLVIGKLDIFNGFFI